MSIATKTGDKGTTGMLFGARVSKFDQRIAAVGDIDELNAALGLVKRQLVRKENTRDYVHEFDTIQRQLTWLMGEVATEPDKRAEYVSKYPYITIEHLEQLEDSLQIYESSTNTKQTDWVMYGNSDASALCDFASKVCRRAERSFLIAKNEEQCESDSHQYRPLLAMYLNRLSDFLYVVARYYDFLETLN
jgi:cob(I)alamin adenosyltransferase